MRTLHIHPLRREHISRHLTQRSQSISPHARAIAMTIGPTTIPTREIIMVAATITRPYTITQATFISNFFHDASVRADVLLSHDVYTDLDAQVRDQRLSRQRGYHVGFIPSQRGPTYDLDYHYTTHPCVLKAYLYAPTLIGAIITITILTHLD